MLVPLSDLSPELEHPQQAIQAFQSILDLKTGHDDAVYAQTQLVELNRELERWPDVEEGLRRLISLAGTDEERVRLLAVACSLCRSCDFVM